MLGVVERGKRTEAELVERNQRLQAELLATQDQVKWLEKTGSTMRVKLQVAVCFLRLLAMVSMP